MKFYSFTGHFSASCSTWKELKASFFTCICRYNDYDLIARQWQVAWWWRSTLQLSAEGQLLAHRPLRLDLRFESQHTKFPFMLQTLHWLQVAMSGNMSLCTRPRFYRKVCTGFRGTSANKNFLLEKLYISLHKKYNQSMKWSKKDCKTAQVCTIIAGAEKQGCYHAVATIVLCLMPIFTLHVSIFPGMQRAGTKGTAPGSDGGCYGSSAVPRWRLDLRLPLIGITGILWPTLSYEYLKLWARRQVWCFFPILEPISKKPVVEKGSSCSVKVILMGYINFLLQNSSPPKPVKSLKDPETPKRWYHGQTIREFFSTAHLLCSWTASSALQTGLPAQVVDWGVADERVNCT